MGGSSYGCTPGVAPSQAARWLTVNVYLFVSGAVTVHLRLPCNAQSSREQHLLTLLSGLYSVIWQYSFEQSGQCILKCRNPSNRKALELSERVYRQSWEQEVMRHHVSMHLWLLKGSLKALYWYNHAELKWGTPKRSQPCKTFWCIYRHVTDAQVSTCAHWCWHIRMPTHARSQGLTHTHTPEKSSPIDKKGHRVHSYVIYWTRRLLASSGLFLWQQRRTGSNLNTYPPTTHTHVHTHTIIH